MVACDLVEHNNGLDMGSIPIGAIIGSRIQVVSIRYITAFFFFFLGDTFWCWVPLGFGDPQPTLRLVIEKQ